VLVPAVTGDHRRNCLPFPGKTLAGKVQVDCPAFFRRWSLTRGFARSASNHRRRQFRLDGSVRP
jgi:hypothetical protein